jgi:hypothetical protein
LNWEESSVNDFLQSASKYNSRIDVEWTGQIAPNTKVRICIISSLTDWRTEISNSFVPRYKDGKDPHDATAQIYTLREWAKTLTVKEVIDYAERFQTGVNVTTAFYSVWNARLIVDGLKRSGAIEVMVNNYNSIPHATVIECYGTDVAKTFPTEFAHIVKN